MTWTSEAVVHGNSSSPVTLEPYEIPVAEDGNLPPTKVLVKTEFAAINPVDIKLHALSLFNGKKHTLRDFSGEVIAVGKEASTKFKVGDKVWGVVNNLSDERFVGSLTLIDLKSGTLSKVPPSLTTQQAGSIGTVFGTAFQMLQHAEDYGQKLGPNSKVLVLGGATVVGSYVIQLAKKYYEIGQVVATCAGTSAEYVKDLGADATLDYRKGNLSQQFTDYVAQNGGEKFDAILDAVGGYDALAVFPSILKPASAGSAYISVMGDSGPQQTYSQSMFNALMSLPRIFFRQFFGKYYGINYRMFFLTHESQWVDAANEVFSIPGFKVLIDSVYPIADFKEAWAKVDSTHARGKVLLQF